jgi:hypothetical protein
MLQYYATDKHSYLPNDTTFPEFKMFYTANYETKIIELNSVKTIILDMSHLHFIYSYTEFMLGGIYAKFVDCLLIFISHELRKNKKNKLSLLTMLMRKDYLKPAWSFDKNLIYPSEVRINPDDTKENLGAFVSYQECFLLAHEMTHSLYKSHFKKVEDININRYLGKKYQKFVGTMLHLNERHLNEIHSNQSLREEIVCDIVATMHTISIWDNERWHDVEKIAEAVIATVYSSLFLEVIKSICSDLDNFDVNNFTKSTTFFEYEIRLHFILSTITESSPDAALKNLGYKWDFGLITYMFNEHILPFLKKYSGSNIPSLVDDIVSPEYGSIYFSRFETFFGAGKQFVEKNKDNLLIQSLDMFYVVLGLRAPDLKDLHYLSKETLEYINNKDKGFLLSEKLIKDKNYQYFYDYFQQF